MSQPKILDVATMEAITAYIHQVAPDFDYLLLIGSDNDQSGRLHVMSSMPPEIQFRMVHSFVNALVKNEPIIEGEFDLDGTKH